MMIQGVLTKQHDTALCTMTIVLKNRGQLIGRVLQFLRMPFLTGNRMI